MNTQKSKVVSWGRVTNKASEERGPLGYRPHAVIDRIDDPETAGFSGSCETTLTDWIQLVQMGRRDAVLSVRTHEGKEGTLWCREGDIIDAVCDGLAGEEGVYRALSWQGGKVSIAFGPFQHRRRIQVATSGLLLGAAYRKDAGIPDLGYQESVPAAASLGPRGSSAGIATLQSQGPTWQKRPTALLFAAAGGFLALALLSGLLSKWVFPLRARGVTELLAPPPLADPAAAGRAVFDAAATSQSLPLSRSEAGVAGSERFAVHVQFVQKPTGAGPALARHRGMTMRARPSRATSPYPNVVTSAVSESPRGPAPASLDRLVVEESEPHVQIIDERKPTVQIIDELKPRVDVIE